MGDDLNGPDRADASARPGLFYFYLRCVRAKCQ